MSYTNYSVLDNVKEVVKECIAGNRSTQNNFYEYYAPKMMGVCLRYAKSRNEAKEILQEGFIKVFTCLHQYKFKGSLEGWIKTIMINCALQLIRSRNTLYSITSIEETNIPFICADVLMDSIDVKHLLQLVQHLPTMYKLVFNLYVFEGFKHKEIAGMLHISEGTSKSNLHDARIILQKKLQAGPQVNKSKTNV